MNIKRVISIIVVLIVFIGVVNGQTEKPVFLGIQPSITIEPFYEEGELDVNLFPLVLEIPVGKMINFRFLPTANYHFGGEKNGFSDLGFYCVLPIFIKKKESAEIRPYGFYIGPVFGFGRNLINNHFTTTFALEPGYLFRAKRNFTISLGLQLGGSYFIYDANPNTWYFHWGPKVSLGFWLDRTG